MVIRHVQIAPSYHSVVCGVRRETDIARVWIFFSRLQYSLCSFVPFSSTLSSLYPLISLFTQPTRWTKLQASFNQLPYTPVPHTSVSRVGEEGEVSMGTTHNYVRPVYTHYPIALSPYLFSPQSTSVFSLSSPTADRHLLS